MFKNIVKSICWVVLYFVTQFVSVFGIILFDLFTGKLVVPDTQDADKMAEELMNYITSLAIPSLLLAAVIFFVIFTLYKLIRKHEFDFKSIDVSTLLGALGLGLILNVVITLVINLIVPILPDFMGDSLTFSTEMVLTEQPFWLILIGVGIVTPILEELTFRYGICGTMWICVWNWSNSVM